MRPVSEDSPAGENLEYDAAFGELERAARGKEERHSGDQVVPAEPPRWREVAEQASALLDRTRDLRVTFYLTHAALNVDGLAGLAAGLRLTHGLLQNFWDTVYPQLDKDDNDDPTLRLNSLAQLAGDDVVRSLARVPLAESRVAGRYGLRDIRLASGEITAPEGEKVPESALVDAAFMECELDALRATAAAASEASSALESVSALLIERVGAQSVPNVDGLTRELRAIQAVLKPRLEARGVSAAADGAAAGAAPGQAGVAVVAVGEIRSRDDAVRAIDHISDYFRKNEPSSPVPLLLQRAKRLVAKDFMEILRDLTPDAVSQAEAIGGVRSEE
ncbi:MAG TPA: type VI secretion system protein TssA [Gammaproteobacteria bacterium]|nr:type VI secretion system protein TssA [Gammaproteobacteria bacterium]